MQATQVKCQCISKKELKNWDAKNPIVTEIELEVPYDQNSIYHKLSGGTNMVLRTVNQAAANMFKIGSDFMLTIEPAPVEQTAETQPVSSPV